MKLDWVGTLYVLIALSVSLIPPEALAQVKVGTTKDACGKEHPVVFNNVIVDGVAGQPVRLHVGDPRKTFELPAPVRELDWFCGYSRETSSNDEPYDQVSVQRSKTGALTFEFFRKQPSNTFPSKGGSLAHIGDTKDACDKTQLVTFEALDGLVPVSAGQQNMEHDLPAPTKEIQFMCGTSPEVARSDTPFDRVRISRASNGAITWIFLLKTAAPDPAHVCNQVHAFGRLVFQGEDGKLAGLARVQVKLMDEDFGPTDTEMAHGFTDADGRFDLRGESGDKHCIGAGCARPDPYVEFILEEDHRVDVQNPVGNSARQQTTTHVDTCGDINFGDQEWQGSTIEAILYARAQRAYKIFTDLTGEPRLPESDGLVTVMYPDGITSQYTFFDTIHWPASTDYRKFYFILDHEFGHRIRDGADGDGNHWNWDNVRFDYASAHTNPNQGSAFHEGWAEYFNSVIDPDLHKQVNDYVPDGTWTGPHDDTMELYVAYRLFNLSDACGGFVNLWRTLEANPGTIHSLKEFESEFSIRNPQCVRKGSSHNAPLTSGSSGTPAVRNIPLVPQESQPKQLSEPALLAQRVELDRHIEAIAKRAENAHSLTPLRIPADLPTSSRDMIGRLNLQHATLAQTFHVVTADAYRSALETLAKMPPPSRHDGTYEAAMRKVRDEFATSVLNARLHLLREADSRMASEKAQTHERQLITYIDLLREKYARAEAELNHILESRALSAKVPDGLLPKSFWGTATESRPLPSGIKVVAPVGN